MAGKTKSELLEIGKKTKFSKENQPATNGRKKKLPGLDELLADLLGGEDGIVEGSEAKAVLQALIKEAKAGNVSAGVAVLNRAYGLPKQPVEHTGDMTLRGGNLADEKTIEALKRIAESD